MGADTDRSTSPSGRRILVVDDEEVLLDLLRDALKFAGYSVSAADCGFDALASARDEPPDLVVLDVNLPDIDGFEVCRRLRADGDDVPVIFLTARDDPEDLRTGFTRGGDDYLTKPFSLEELDLRIAAILRRQGGTVTDGEVLRCGDLTMDDDAHRVHLGPDEIELSPTEYRLLHYLLLNRGRALTKTQILEHVWDYDFGGNAAVVETYISYLRRKLDRRDGSLIRTVRGVGYSLDDPQQRA